MIKTYKPIEVKILTIIFIWIIVWNLTRFVQIILSWNPLYRYSDHSILMYIIVSASAWIFIGLFLIVPIWLGREWAWVGSVGTISSYALWLLVDRFLIQKPLGNGSLVWFINIILLILTLVLLFSKNLRVYYHD